MPNKLTGLFYGWHMVAATCALRVLGAGLHSFGFTVFFLPLSQDLNLNRTSTSLAFSLARAEGAIEGPIVGHLLDRHGPRPIMLAAVLLMGVGYLLLSQVNSYVFFLIVYLGVISLAHAGGFMHAPMVLINTWFIRHRARAITISSAAFGLGGVLVAPILSVIVQTWGWRWGAAIGGILFLAIGVPLSLTVRRSPESMGLLPDGDEPARPQAVKDGQEQAIRSEVDVTVAEALRSFAFWGSVLAAAIRNGSYHAISVHFVPLMVWKGLSQSEAALLLSVYAFLGMASTLILGWFADKANKPRLTAVILFAGAAAMFLLILGSSLWSLCLFTMFFALVETTFPLGWAVVGDLFGRKHYAKIRGYMVLFYTWGGVLGPVIAGAIFDRWATYEPLLWSLVGVFIVAGLFFASLNRSWQRATGQMRAADWLTNDH
ncbi:MAG: MFS transporter [Deltaproteobacteria bacterium]|nr:MFS transporter [Deltaproteobacteria bacterium]MBI2179306.1 MFS transporter [Deltaproteobacteria bacterium]